VKRGTFLLRSLIAALHHDAEKGVAACENQAYIDKLNCKQQLVASGVEEAQGNRGCDLGAAEVLK